MRVALPPPQSLLVDGSRAQPMSETNFEKYEQTLAQAGPDALLTSLADTLRAEAKYHELFDVLLMRERLKLGLPAVLASSIEDLPPELRDQLETAYLAVCRQIGTRLLEEKRVREAWTYLRPLGDAPLVREGIAAIEPDEENLQPLVEILLHEGVDVARGYQLVLDHYGTCNAITAYEGLVRGRSRADQQQAAASLARRLREELLTNLRADILEREGAEPAGHSIRELVSPREALFADDRYHIDTTHLASTVRFARVLEDPEAIRVALDLAEYGRRLSPQFQFADEEPFTDMYASHALFFSAQLGESVEEALACFRQRADEIDAYHQGTLAIEVYVVLLARLGRYDEAIVESATRLPPGTHTTGFAPTLMELSRRAGNFTRLLELCRERGDVVGYTAALIAAQEAAADS